MAEGLSVGTLLQQKQAQILVHLTPGILPFEWMVQRSGRAAYGDLVLVEDNVVGEASVVDPLDGVTGLDGDVGRLEDQGAAVAAQLNGGGVSAQGEAQSGDADTSDLGDPTESHRNFAPIPSKR